MAVPGRARLRVHGLRRSPALRRALEGGLGAAAGIHRVSASPVTGNLVILFDPVLPLAAISERIDAILRFGHREPGLFEEDHDGPAWHRLSGEDVASRLASPRKDGLDAADVRRRLARCGHNTLPVPPSRSNLDILTAQVATLPIALLTGAAALSVLSGGLFDAAMILGVVALNAGIGYATESRTERTIRTLQLPAQRAARVIRGGASREVPIEDIVPGDLLPLEPGMIVPADARILRASELSVSEAALTGESQPARKSPAMLRRRHLPLAERANMVYRGTLVTGGTGSAIAVATGGETQVGRIQRLVGTAIAPETPLQRQLDDLGRRLVFYSSAVCGLMLLLGLSRGYGLLQMIKSAVSLAVAAVPEGLPTLATTALALGIEDMRRRKVLIRHLDALETLAAVQVICFDKTGTLTLNRMSVTAVAVGERELHAADGRFADEAGLAVELRQVPEARRLFEICTLCSDVPVEIGRAILETDASPTERALFEAALDLGIDAAELRRQQPRLAARHRAESRRFMMTLHGDNGGTLAAMKGSPADVLALCEKDLYGGGERPLTAARRQAIAGENDRMAARGLRVLGVALKRLARQPGNGTGIRGMEREVRGLTWVGLVGIADPARHGLAPLMARFHRAGIRTVMITGDQSATAQAVAATAGLDAAPDALVLDADRLQGATADSFAEMAGRAYVFARVTPAQKLRIVEALQRTGAVVAMTGDGINGGPALRAADVGVAMGTAGTDAAREIADIILQDDELATMMAAIERGRTTYGNIRKAIRYLLATNLSEIIVMLVAIGTRLGQPLSPLQLLWINLLSDILPAVGLALEPPEADVLSKPPRDPREPIVRRDDFRSLLSEATVIGAGALGTMGYGALRYGASARTGTLAFGSLVTAQLLHALTCRSPQSGLFTGGPLPANRALTGTLALSFGLQGAAFLVPPLRRLLGLAPIGGLDTLVMLGGGVLPYLANEAMKAR